jgi:hypothetical protein
MVLYEIFWVWMIAFIFHQFDGLDNEQALLYSLALNAWWNTLPNPIPHETPPST